MDCALIGTFQERKQLHEPESCKSGLTPPHPSPRSGRSGRKRTAVTLDKTFFDQGCLIVLWTIEVP